MVDPSGIVAAVKRIDHPAIVQMKVKSVVGVAGVVRVTANGLGHADDLAHVFNDRFTRRHVARGEHAFAVHAG